MKRVLWTAAVAAVLAGCASAPKPAPVEAAPAPAAATPAAVPASLTNVADRPRREPVTDTVFGRTIVDPYRWMEDPARADEMGAWVRRASADATRQLAALPGRAELVREMQTASRAGVSYSDVQAVGDRVFARRLDADATLPKLVVREADGRERVLLDPAATPSGAKPAAINNYSPSPSGRLVAIHQAEGGGEVGSIRFYDVDGMRPLPDVLTPVWGEMGASWVDETTVIYTRMDDRAGADPTQNMDVRLRRLGRPASEERVLLAPGSSDAPRLKSVEFPIVGDLPLSPWTLGFAAGARADARVFVARDRDVVAGRPRWRELADYADQIQGADAFGDHVYYLTSKVSPNGELRRLNAARGTLATSEPILPPGDEILVDFAVARDGIYVVTMKDGLNGLLFLPGGKGPARRVAVEPGAIDSIGLSYDRSRVVFPLTQWTRARRYLAAEGGVVRELGMAADTWAGASDLVAVTDEAVSADGTRVPMTIVRRKDATPDSKRPTFLDAYGSYGQPTTPYYDARKLAWVARGYVFAECGVRGGGEKGRAWHEAGRSANKPNAHADLIACAERLVALGWTSPGHMAVSGTSAGGLLAPPAALKRPDLFKVVVPRVAVVNPTRLAVARNGANQFAEMGDPNTQAGFEALVAQDAYLMLKGADRSPDWFLTVGLNDRRVEPWMSAKFAARALERLGDRQVVFVRADADAGHGIGSTRDQQIEEWADIYAFMLNRFGDPAFQSPSGR